MSAKILIIGSTGKLGIKLVNFCYKNLIKISAITCYSNKKLIIDQSKKSNIKNYNTTFADVTMGLSLRDNNIEIENFDLFKSQPPKYYNISEDEIKNYISFHYIKSYHEMNKLYQLCK